MSKKRLFSMLSASTLILFALSALFTVPALAAGGAIWCPKGVGPNPGIGGCTASYSNLGGLVGHLSSVVHSTNGVIWTSAGPDNTASNITIDGSVLTTLANYNLTLQGGWTGTSAGKISGTSNFSHPIAIVNWKSDVTINDLSISGASGSKGLTVITRGNIRVHHIQSTNNGTGANLDDSSGTGSISVDTSTLNGNTSADGLDASSHGTITLSAVTANANKNNGAFLDNTGSGATNISASTFNSNTTYGLNVASKGAITLNNVTANLNTGYGAHLDNTGSGAITVSTSTFNKNTTYGLNAVSTGAIYLNKVTASFNKAGNGAYLDNTGIGAPRSIKVISSIFNSNAAGSGLSAYSHGAITLNNVTADTNTGYGVFLLNSAMAGDINISSSTFNGNTTEYGILAGSIGNINLNKVTANANTGYGAFLRNNYAGSTGVITISSSTFNSNTTGGSATGNGLVAYSSGAITLNVTATRNANDGVFAKTTRKIVVSCGSNISTNGAYGIEATLPSGGSLILRKIVTLIGNTLGPTRVSGGGTVVHQPTCP